MITTSLDSAYASRNSASLLGLALVMWAGVGIMVTAGTSFPVFVGVALVFVFMSIYRPLWFLYVVLSFFLFKESFELQTIYTSWGVSGGLGQGRGFLSFLRSIDPSSATTYDMYKVIWIATLVRPILLYRNSGRIFHLDVSQRYLLAFLLISVTSAIANLTIDKTTLRFIMTFSLPILMFYYIRTTRLSVRETQLLFAYLLFCGLEMQVLFNFVNNYEAILQGDFFFGDDAIGTFKHPHYEVSAYFMSFAFFLCLYRFLIHRKRRDLVRALIAFYGILSVSVILYTGALMAFTLFSFAYATKHGIIRVRELFVSIFMALLLVGAVSYQLQQDAATEEHLNKHVTKAEEREWWELPVIYSYVNLKNMFMEEGKWLFGVSPGRFLTSFGRGPYYERYNSYAVYDTHQLSSSERLENSVVGIMGEVGPLGYLCLILAYVPFVRQLNRRNRWLRRQQGLVEVPYAMLSIALLFFWSFSFIRNLMEELVLMLSLMVMVSLAYQMEWQKDRARALDVHGSSQ